MKLASSSNIMNPDTICHVSASLEVPARWSLEGALRVTGAGPRCFAGAV